jgi:hypothetical protein
LGGNILACAFTDDKIRVLDFRLRTAKKEAMVLESDHTDKQLALSSDGTVLLSSG